MLRSEKKEFVTELEDVYAKSNVVIVTHYHGLTVSEITELRQKLREGGASFKVTKNTLSKIALNDSKLKAISGMFSGPTAVAYSEDIVSAAKGVVQFAKANENLKIIGGIANDQLLEVAEIKKLASLPSLDELRAKLIGALKAPAAKLAGVAQAPASKLVGVLQAYAAKG